jgi:hypothetical protein
VAFHDHDTSLEKHNFAAYYFVVQGNAVTVHHGCGPGVCGSKLRWKVEDWTCFFEPRYCGQHARCIIATRYLPLLYHLDE